jgi:hypothetical protein
VRERSGVVGVMAGLGERAEEWRRTLRWQEKKGGDGDEVEEKEGYEDV